jgi:hypothetical protein
MHEDNAYQNMTKLIEEIDDFDVTTGADYGVDSSSSYV